MSDRLKVLCVDDNEDSARTAAEILRLAGCDARVCHDGQSALAEASDYHPDVCVLDLTMPGMSGYELAGRLREAAAGWPPKQRVRLIALTGQWDVESQHRTNNAGFDAHLVKPADPVQLVAAVRGQEPTPPQADARPE